MKPLKGLIAFQPQAHLETAGVSSELILHPLSGILVMAGKPRDWLRSKPKLIAALALGVALGAAAQPGPFPTNTLMPIVTVRATDPLASWSGDTGTFTVFREGPTNLTLNVFYQIGGTASNGVDYASLGRLVMIPAGIRTNTITVNPIEHGQTSVETVALRLAPSPMMPPVNYVIGLPDRATVFITPASVTNIPPLVSLVQPTDNAAFFTPVNIPLLAIAADLDGSVGSVEFFANGNSLGISTNFAVIDPLPGGGYIPGSRGFFLTWSNPPAGRFALTGLATDNGGASTLSDPVNITVLSGPPTNLPPIVRIASPPNGAVFRAPVDIPLFAYARDPDGSVAALEFFDGTNSLGLAHDVCSTLPRPMPICPTNLFVLVWSNAPIGRHELTAHSTGNDGVSAVSTAVHITVLESPPPATNRPPVVSIMATDPVAIEGTNCWPWLGLTNPAPVWSNWPGPIAFCRWFTNCGPKNATFMVHRFGETNNDLTISYAVAGTATNGVDYVPLSGSVTLPAGQRRASITIVPLDDGPPDVNSTVVLRLNPATNSPPDYVLGRPARAAVIILDRVGMRPTTDMLSDGSFHMSTTGPDGAWFHVEYSTDLLNWTPIVTNQVINGEIDFVDPDAAADLSRFYRAVPEAGPPAD